MINICHLIIIGLIALAILAIQFYAMADDD